MNCKNCANTPIPCDPSVKERCVTLLYSGPDLCQKLVPAVQTVTINCVDDGLGNQVPADPHMVVTYVSSCDGSAIELKSDANPDGEYTLSNAPDWFRASCAGATVDTDTFGSVRDNGDGTFTFVNADGTDGPNWIGDGHTLDTDTWVTVTDNGDGTFSGVNVDASVITWAGVDTFATIADNGDGTFTGTNANGTAVTWTQVTDTDTWSAATFDAATGVFTHTTPDNVITTFTLPTSTVSGDLTKSGENLLTWTDPGETFLLNQHPDKTGFDPVHIGFDAGDSDSGNRSVHIGREAGQRNSGTRTIFLGDLAGRDNESDAAIGIGRAALEGNTGIDPIGIGDLAGNYASGDYGVFVGSSSGLNNTGHEVSGFGSRAASDNTGNNVVAAGPNAAELNNGSDVVAIGPRAAIENEGNNVIALGTDAGNGNTVDNAFIVGFNQLPQFPNQAAANAVLPAPGPNGIYLYLNSTTGNIEVAGLGTPAGGVTDTFGTLVDNADGTYGWTSADGATTFQIDTRHPYDVTIANMDNPEAGKYQPIFVAPRALDLSAGTYPAMAITPPTADVTYTVRKIAAGGATTDIGTVTYAAGSVTGVATITAATAFAVGDSLGHFAPAGADADIADTSVSYAFDEVL